MQVDPFSTDGASPLHLAVHYNRGDLVDILLSQPSCNIRAVNAQVTLAFVIITEGLFVARAPLLYCSYGSIPMVCVVTLWFCHEGTLCEQCLPPCLARCLAWLEKLLVANGTLLNVSCCEEL